MKAINDKDPSSQKYRCDFSKWFIAINITNLLDFQNFYFPLCKKIVFEPDFFQHIRGPNMNVEVHDVVKVT